MLALLPLLLALSQAPSSEPPPPLPIIGTAANGGRVFRVGLGLRFDSIASQIGRAHV